MNWDNRGELLGRGGHDISKLSEEVKSCEQKGVTVDITKLKMGWFRGIKSYCTFEKGHEIGGKGIDNPNVCPKRFKKSFDRGYYYGSMSQKSSLKETTAILRPGNRLDNRLCQKHSDCLYEDQCSGTTCELSGSSCVFDRDCKIQGLCKNKKCDYL